MVAERWPCRPTSDDSLSPREALLVLEHFPQLQTALLRWRGSCRAYKVAGVRLSDASTPTQKGQLSLAFVLVAHPGRFELPTLGFVVRCSIQLSYGCVGGECIARVFGTDSGKCALDRPAREWALGGGCGPALKRLQRRGATMTAKPGQTSSGAGLRYWKEAYLARMTRFSQRAQPMARKLL